LDILRPQFLTRSLGFFSLIKNDFESVRVFVFDRLQVECITVILFSETVISTYFTLMGSKGLWKDFRHKLSLIVTQNRSLHCSMVVVLPLRQIH
jgi:hypothetical protein